jgi:hypothetical protein
LIATPSKFELKKERPKSGKRASSVKSKKSTTPQKADKKSEKSSKIDKKVAKMNQPKKFEKLAKVDPKSKAIKK